MQSHHNLPAKIRPPDPVDTQKKSQNTSTNSVPIHKDLDSWIRLLHLSTLPKELDSPLTVGQFLNGKILTDIALAQGLIKDHEIVSNSPETLCRLVVEQLFKEECVEAQNETIMLLSKGNALVLEKILRALKALRKLTIVETIFANVPELSYQGLQDGLEKLSPASLCSEDSCDERLSSICPENYRSISSALPGPSSAEQELEEKYYQLSHELGETRFAAENWKWQYEQLDERLKAIQETNDNLESALLSIRSEYKEQYKEKVREMKWKHEKEKDEILINMSDVSNCAQKEAISLQREVNRLQGLLTKNQASADEILRERNSVIESNTKLQREKAEMKSELQMLRGQLKEAQQNFKLKLDLAIEEKIRCSERWEKEKKVLLESLHSLVEQNVKRPELNEPTLVEDDVSNLHEDIEASISKPKPTAKATSIVLREKNKDALLRVNPIYRKWMQNRRDNPLDFFSLLLLFIFRVLRYIAGAKL